MTIPPDRERIVAAMRAGGYFDRILSAGPELDRVKGFLLAFAGERPSTGAPMQNPRYPCFPGLRHTPFHEVGGHEGVAALERAFETVRAEALALGEVPLDYTVASRPVRSLLRPWSWLRGRASPRAWTVYPLYHMGVDVEPVAGRCPGTLAAVRSLPRLCADYPWGDVVFSVQGPKSRLPPHCSVDNLRLRCHLALRIPEGNGIRVGPESRSWTEGRCLLFEDSYEHEVWNTSSEPRIVLIADFWHPDLTDAEIRALTAGFRKSEVRRVFLRERIQMTSSPDVYVRYLEQAMAEQDATPLVREFWNG